jgi:hypothetical protein
MGMPSSGVARIAQLPRLADIVLRVSDPGCDCGRHLDLNGSQELIALALPRHLRRAHLSGRRIVGRAPADGGERQCGDGDG